MHLRRIRCFLLTSAAFFVFYTARAQSPKPASVLAYSPGACYLASYEVRDVELVVISSPEKLRASVRVKAAARRLATAPGFDDEHERKVAPDSKVIVHIAGGLHASAVGTATSIVLACKLAPAQNDSEIDTILNNVVLLLWPTLNPDGRTWWSLNIGKTLSRVLMSAPCHGFSRNMSATMISVTDMLNMA